MNAQGGVWQSVCSSAAAALCSHVPCCRRHLMISPSSSGAGPKICTWLCPCRPARQDQCRREMAAGRVFRGLREGPITFRPTYKFDKVGRGGLARPRAAGQDGRMTCVKLAARSLAAGRMAG